MSIWLGRDCGLRGGGSGRVSGRAPRELPFRGGKRTDHYVSVLVSGGP
jgi:hypothetical protein